MWTPCLKAQVSDSLTCLRPKEIDYFIRQKLRADNFEYKNVILTATVKEYKSLVVIKNQIIRNDSLLLVGADAMYAKQNEKISTLNDQVSKYYRKTQRQKTYILILSSIALTFGVLSVINK